MLKHSYTNGIVHQKIAIIGPQPPPLGGVSLHIERTSKKLERAHNTVSIFDANKYSRVTRYGALLIFFFIRWPKVIYVHSLYNNILEWLITAFYACISKAEITIVEHDCRYLDNRSVFFKYTLKKTMYLAQQQVFIGNLTLQSYQKNHIPVLKKHRIESAFLPPEINDESAILLSYPPELFAFLKNHHPIIMANGSRFIDFQGKDLYGFDRCAKLLHALKNDFPQGGLIIAIAWQGDKALYENLLALVDQLNITSSVFFVQGQRHIWPLIKRSSLFLRPTHSDGYSVSIEEAIWLNVPSIASDVCWRPEQTTTFSNNNEHEFFLKSKAILKHELSSK